MAHGPQLITYVDRLAGDFRSLNALLTGPLAGAFSGVHPLPFYTPYDGVDAGFDPKDHTAVDPRLGGWADVRALAEQHAVMADVIVNHVSSGSAQFRNFVERGDQSPHAPMFLTLSSVFPEGATEADLARIYRPRPGMPFTAMTIGGQRRLVWTTFTADQVDIDLRSPQAWEYLTSILDALTSGGVTQLRLDAVGYTGKEAGTDCFMTPATDEYTERIVALARERGAEVLVEVHGHYKQQLEIAAKVDYVYDFALPPLVLHTLTTGDVVPLSNWMGIRPANSITVLDTHDGIGIVDVGTSDLRPGEPGLLPDKDIDALVERIHENSRGTSRLATGAAASNLDLYQVNCTFFDALGHDATRYLLARLIQLFTPGIPQVYYVGLLAGANDVDLLKRTGVGRDVNRHYYTPGEVEAALTSPVVQDIVTGLRLRNSHLAFDGNFTWHAHGSSATMRWVHGHDIATLTFDAATAHFEVTATDHGGKARSVMASQ